MKVSIHIDGACSGNPGPAGAGAGVSDAAGEPCAPDEPPQFNAKIATGIVSLNATPDGDGWTIRDDALKAEPERARFQLKIGGKTYIAPLEHEH